MERFKSGQFVIAAGHFEAFMREGVKDCQNPLLTCFFRVLAHPSGLDHLRRVRDQVGLGGVWEKNYRAGWTINLVDEMAEFYQMIAAGATRSHRADTIERWGHCVSLLPKVLRAHMRESGGTYRAVDHLDKRRQAVHALHEHYVPPIFPRLPAGYFDQYTF